MQTTTDNALNGRTALVTGAGRGIGRTAAQALAASGAYVVLSDLDGRSAETSAAAIRAAGGAAMGLAHDVASSEDWVRVVDRIRAETGRLDVLVNNAGVFLGLDTEEMDLDAFRKTILINCEGVFLGTKMALPLMKETAAQCLHGASIVNISSAAGIIGLPLDPAYSMSKGGVRLYTKATAIEFAQKQYRIRVNSIHPGVVETPMGDGLVRQASARVGIESDNEARALVASLHPLGRMAEPEDIADAVVFLASDASRFMTGSELVVDGGVTAQ